MARRSDRSAVKITLECTECKRRNYITMKNKVNDRERIEMKKYCRHERRHTRPQGDPLTGRGSAGQRADTLAPSPRGQ